MFTKGIPELDFYKLDTHPVVRACTHTQWRQQI